MDWVVGIDAGGSGSRAVLAPLDPCDGRPLAYGEQNPVVGPGLGPDGRGHPIGALLDALADALGLARRPVAVGIGVSGLMSLTEGPGAVAAMVRRAFGPLPVAVATDAVTAVAGALGLEGGAVVVAGTGATGFGTNFNDVWCRVDGWGHVLGDLGSGSWVGNKGLQAGLRYLDGRSGGSSQLAAHLLERFGDPDRLCREIYTRPDRAAVLAAFAPDVAVAAKAGDSVAAAVWEQAGTHLADTLASAIHPGVPTRAAYGGGLFAAGALLQVPFMSRWAERVQRSSQWPNPVSAKGTPLDGAVALARAARHGSVLSRPPYLWVG